MRKLIQHTRVNTSRGIAAGGGPALFALRVLAAGLIGWEVWQPHGAPWLTLALIWLVLPRGGDHYRAEAGAVVLLAYFLGSARAPAESLAGFLQIHLAAGWGIAGAWAILMAAPWLVIGACSRSSLVDLWDRLRLLCGGAPRMRLRPDEPGPALASAHELARWAAYLTVITLPPLGALGMMPPAGAVMSIGDLLPAGLPAGWGQFLVAMAAILLAAAGVRALALVLAPALSRALAAALGWLRRHHTAGLPPGANITHPRAAAIASMTLLIGTVLGLGGGAGAGAGAGIPHARANTHTENATPYIYVSADPLHLGQRTRLGLIGLRVHIPAGVLATLEGARGFGTVARSLRLEATLGTTAGRRGALVATQEFAAGNLCRYPQAAMPLYRYWARHPKTVFVIGARIKRADGPGCTDGALVLSGDGISTVAAGQPAPVSEWRPWSSSPDYPAHWFRPAVVSAPPVGRVAVLVCYDGALAWFPMLDASSRPAVIASLEGHRWRYGHWVSALQRRIIAGWGRFYQVPTVIGDASLGADSLEAWAKKKGTPRLRRALQMSGGSF